jgi:hypothetical protein
MKRTKTFIDEACLDTDGIARSRLCNPFHSRSSADNRPNFLKQK